MNPLMVTLLKAITGIKHECYVRTTILRNKTMSLPQTIIAAIFSLTDKAQYGFYVAEEPAMIEAIIEVAELPMTGESYQAVKANLPGLMAPLKAIGVEVVHQGDYVTYFGPGVLKHV